MGKLTKSLWLILPPAVIVAAWMATRRGGGAEPATTPTSDFILVAGSLLGALAISLAGFLLTAHTRETKPAATTRGARTDLFRVVQSRRISSRHWIHAVEFDSRIVLVGATDNNMVLLDAIADSADDAAYPNYSDDGVDLRDTPSTGDGDGTKLRSLANAPRAARLGRTALTVANLADFKAKLRQARESRV